MINSNHSALSFKLEIVIVTYNRASTLDNMLLQLNKSSFRDVKITIIDNFSTDDTQEICRKYLRMFPCLTIESYKKNIGKSAAYLHAVESVSAEYTWILSDDHIYDFSSVSQLVQAIESGVYDVLYVDSRAELIWNGNESCSMTQLIAAKSRVHATFTSWSALIFRTSLFDEECIVRGYRLINYVYPNFPFINSLVGRNARTYVSTHQIVNCPEINSRDARGLLWYSSWVNCCQTINDRSLRELSINDATINYGFIKTLTFWIARDRQCNSKQHWYGIVDILWGLSLRQRLKFILLLPLILVLIPQVWSSKFAKIISSN
ncbi:MAG: glycosyltransferase family 2 protein [Desulfuromonadaceae bacterium]|nr:glycosyltransferase family 2 protein [Desulfuromonadaceae bacterium]